MIFLIIVWSFFSGYLAESSSANFSEPSDHFPEDEFGRCEGTFDSHERTQNHVSGSITSPTLSTACVSTRDYKSVAEAGPIQGFYIACTGSTVSKSDAI